MPLTDVVLRKLKPGAKTVRYSDEKGLYLQVAPSGGMWWRLKFRFEGKEKVLALGVYPEVSLKEAREKRDEARTMLRNGIDPTANRKAQKAAEGKAGKDEFEVVAREWHGKFSLTWDSAKYRDITLRRLELNVFPWLGNRPIAAITAPELLSVIQRIEARGAIDTSHRILGLCGQILRFAKPGSAMRLVCPCWSSSTSAGCRGRASSPTRWSVCVRPWGLPTFWLWPPRTCSTCSLCRPGTRPR